VAWAELLATDSGTATNAKAVAVAARPMERLTCTSSTRSAECPRSKRSRRNRARQGLSARSEGYSQHRALVAERGAITGILSTYAEWDVANVLPWVPARKWLSETFETVCVLLP
jgi:hypothetical protein